MSDNTELFFVERIMPEWNSSTHCFSTTERYRIYRKVAFGYKVTIFNGSNDVVWVFTSAVPKTARSFLVPQWFNVSDIVHEYSRI